MKLCNPRPNASLSLPSCFSTMPRRMPRSGPPPELLAEAVRAMKTKEGCKLGIYHALGLRTGCIL